MGEAKRKSSTDTSGQQRFYGIVMSHVEVEPLSIRYNGSLNAQDLRHAALLWDKIAWPQTNLSQPLGGPDEQFLEQAGFLIKPRMVYPFPSTVEGVAEIVHARTFWALEQQDPGCWSLAQGSDAALRKLGLLMPGRGALVELVSALPVPNEDVPLAEVLNFKLRRVNELLALRDSIEALKTRVLASENLVEAMELTRSEIDRSCSDLLRVGREWRFPVRLVNRKASFELRPLMTGAAGLAGYGAGITSHLPATEAILAGFGTAITATLPSLKISADFGWIGLRSRPSPYRYVYSYHREIF